jgi:hypothetical protein
MMTESETKQAALAHFDRTPILPGHVRVLVQSGTEWYWHELPAGEIWSNLEAFEKSQLRSLRPKRYSELGCQKVSVLLMSAGGRGDDYEACMASLWLLFRRPREKANRHEAKAHLAKLMDDYGAAWIVTVCSDLAELDTMRFHTAHGDWNPLTNDVGIDLTPIRADLGIYGDRVQRPDRPLH